MGPFYCPTDQRIYLDTSFFREIETRFRGCNGKACEFAQAYVIAHEVGHHVQNLLGILPKAQAAQRAAGSKAAANRIQVRVELQADCFAGVWANHSEQRKKFIDPGDIDAALQTAAAIGDDTLQKQRTGARGAGCLHPRLGRAAQALVHDRLQAGQSVGLQHVRGGAALRKRHMPGIDETRQFVPLKIAVLTVSDTRELRRRQIRHDCWSSASAPPAIRSPSARSSRTRSRRSASA